MERIYDMNCDNGTIYHCIEQGILFANTHPNFKVRCVFNGSEFFITSESTVDSCYHDYEVGLRKAEEEYRKSEDYQRFLKRQSEKREKMNSEAKIIMSKFEKLVLPATTFDEMKNVLNWLCEYQPYSDCDICDVADDEIVLKRLKEAGYKVDAHVGNSEITKDMTKYFEYLIGQAMSTMEFIALHGSIFTGRDLWMTHFSG